MISKELLDKLKELEKKHEKWEKLPDDHPDIKELHSIRKESEEIKEPRIFEQRKRTTKPSKVWAEEEDTMLKETFEKYTNKELGLMMGRTPSSIGNRMTILGLKRTNSRSIVRVSCDGKEIIHFANATEAMKKTSIKSSMIHQCCQGLLKNVGGYEWWYKEDWIS